MLPSDTKSRRNTQDAISSIDSSSEDADNFPNPTHVNNGRAQHRILRLPPPVFGAHRPSADAVFTIARGYPPPTLVRFVNSLIESGYDGDIVLGLSSERLNELLGGSGADDVALREYFEYHAAHHHVIVHGIDMDCTLAKGGQLLPSSNSQSDELCLPKNMFQDGSNEGEYLPDPRIRRHISQIRFEYYWAWCRFYTSTSRIFISDVKDVYFQKPPFSLLPNDAASTNSMERTLHVFEEDDAGLNLQTQRANSRWIREARGQAVLNSFGPVPVICSGTTLGGKVAMESYLRAMVLAFDETLCLTPGCDQGHHNYLLYSGRLLETKEEEGGGGGKQNNDNNNGGSKRRRRIEHIEFVPFAKGTVQTLGLFCNFRKGANANMLASHKMLDTSKNFPTVLNLDGSVAPVLHQFNRCQETNKVLDPYGAFVWKEWKKRRLLG